MVYLPLHGDHGLLDGLAGVSEGEEDLTGDVVRQVPDDRQRSALRRRQGRPVHLQHVAVGHL